MLLTRYSLKRDKSPSDNTWIFLKDINTKQVYTAKHSIVTDLLDTIQDHTGSIQDAHIRISKSKVSPSLYVRLFLWRDVRYYLLPSTASSVVDGSQMGMLCTVQGTRLTSLQHLYSIAVSKHLTRQPNQPIRSSSIEVFYGSIKQPTSSDPYIPPARRTGKGRSARW